MQLSAVVSATVVIVVSAMIILPAIMIPKLRITKAMDRLTDATASSLPTSVHHQKRRRDFKEIMKFLLHFPGTVL